MVRDARWTSAAGIPERGSILRDSRAGSRAYDHPPEIEYDGFCHCLIVLKAQRNRAIARRKECGGDENLSPLLVLAAAGMAGPPPARRPGRRLPSKCTICSLPRPTGPSRNTHGRACPIRWDRFPMPRRTLFAEFDRLRILQSQFLTSNDSFLDFHKPDADPVVKKQFEAKLDESGEGLHDALLKMIRTIPMRFSPPCCGWPGIPTHSRHDRAAEFLAALAGGETEPRLC